MFSLRHLAVVFAALFLLPGVFSAVLEAREPPRPSGSPQCQYKCPKEDKRGRDLEREEEAGRYIKCTYGDRNPKICFYEKDDGDAKNGNGDQCPRRADKKDHDRPRREARALYDAYEVERKRRAAMPAPSIPDYMNTRATLKKRD